MSSYDGFAAEATDRRCRGPWSTEPSTPSGGPRRCGPRNRSQIPWLSGEQPANRLRRSPCRHDRIGGGPDTRQRFERAEHGPREPGAGSRYHFAELVKKAVKDDILLYDALRLALRAQSQSRAGAQLPRERCQTATSFPRARIEISTSRLLQTAIALRDEGSGAIRKSESGKVAARSSKVGRPSGVRVRRAIRDLQPWRCSTGPRTESGKARVAMNALRHGYQRPRVAPQSAPHPQRHPPLRQHRAPRTRARVASAT